MKTVLFKRLIIPMLLLTFSIGASMAESREVILFNNPGIYIDEDPTIADRIPSRPIQCIINEDEIFIQGYDTSEIQSYEVYNLDGSCIFSTVDSQAFCYFIINCQITCEIRLTMSDFMLRGYINL